MSDSHITVIFVALVALLAGATVLFKVVSFARRDDKSDRFGWESTLAIVVVEVVAAALLFRASFVSYIFPYEFPYAVNHFTGAIEKVPHKGYIIANPIEYQIYGIDLRPRQVRLEVGASSQSGNPASFRVLNAKLVSFNPNGLDEFLKLHGPQDGDVSELLKIYAFDQQNKSYPFLNIGSVTVSDTGAPN